MEVKLVIENSDGQAVRSIDWHSSSVVVYKNLETGRIELCPSQNDLVNSELPHEVISQTSINELEKRPLSLGGNLLKRADYIDNVVSLSPLSSESTQEIKSISKWTAISHAVLLLLLFLGSLFLSDKKQITEPVIVKVMRQPSEPRATVKASEQKLKKRPVTARVSQKAKISKRTTRTAVPRRQAKRSPIRTQITVNKVGALGALGGVNYGKNGSAGLNLNAANSSLGTSYKNIGKGGAGGQNKAVSGRALISKPVGIGGDAGSGGYATRGKGGGRPGYGAMQTPGGSEGYFLPLEEEALIEGGLDKDQIAAIVNRHIGQIIYCYERGLQVEPDLSGRVAVHFVINGGGHVQTAQVKNSTLRSTKVEGCILNKLRGWKFPKPYGNVNVRVTYPFLLKRVG